MSDPVRSVTAGTAALPEVDPSPAGRKPAAAREEHAAPASHQLPHKPETVHFGAGAAEFSYDPDLDRVIVRIYSSETEPREIVRQFPPEDYLTFAARYRELLGLLFDEEA